MKRDPDTEWLMAHPVPSKRRRSKPWMNFGDKEPRCESCRCTPPACECPKEAS